MRVIKVIGMCLRRYGLLCCLLTAAAAAAAGCSSGTPEVGTYRNSKYPNDSIELKKDGSFVIKEGERSITGKYAIKGKQVVFALGDGSGSTGALSDTGIIDSAGELWHKK